MICGIRCLVIPWTDAVAARAGVDAVVVAEGIGIGGRAGFTATGAASSCAPSSMLAWNAVKDVEAYVKTSIISSLLSRFSTHRFSLSVSHTQGRTLCAVFTEKIPGKLLCAFWTLKATNKNGMATLKRAQEPIPRTPRNFDVAKQKDGRG
jgi:hypothetical protein